MKTSAFAASAASLLSSAVAQQFVMYTSGGDDKSVQRADPILAPGKISQHVHQLFGSNALAPEVSYESLQSAECTTVGDAAGNGNAADKSIYWHPALYMEASDGSGYVKIPTNGHKLYYKDAGSESDKKREPFEFPQGFRMLAGDPFIRSPPSDSQRQNITQWICHDSSGTNQGTYGGFPTGVTDCDAYPGFNGAIHFPHCWNGQDFDAANPTAHITYPDGDIQQGECPSTHPTRLPHIFMENQFDLHSMVNQVKPDSFVLAMGDDTGLGWHADFFNGWKDGAIPGLFDSCPQGEYGNEDVGSCPTFEKGPSNNDCQLKTSFHENVNKPGKNLPGCNPVNNQNPAPMMKIAPLGSYTTQCSPAEGGSSGGSPPPPAYSSSSAAAPVQSSAAGYSSSPAEESSTPVASATTFTTSSTSSDSSPTGYTGGNNNGQHHHHSSSSSGSEVNCPSANGQTYTAPSGQTFQIECNTDHYAGNLKTATAHSLAECIGICDKTSGCVDVSFLGAACYLKKSVGKKVSSHVVDGAKLIKSSGSSGSDADSGDGKVVQAAAAPQVTSAPAYGGDAAATNTHVVYVTEMVTVTASPQKRYERHLNHHLRAHVRRDS